ncbi:MAG: stage 0 sporulation protein [Spirochaetae bacterium HGW-Spirochaetae-1]|jgi:cell fate regulator YaaT (PSP1 superfamily)|nr:MAG: stage 0 sporulation protein [Spirochaetae bacterium HGW-Spirochaetae-1]
MEVSAVRLRNSFQIYYIDTNNIFVNQNALSVVETEHGVDLGRVVKTPRYQNNSSIKVAGKLLRKATREDLDQLPGIEALEEKAFKICREKAQAKGLNMKLISVKTLFDKTKIIFYFVADNRIDFRELVRELASIFRTRIEMRQIGVRDEARLVGGYGPCGKEQCCVNQREEFEPVSIKMAKEQSLNLNSLKISGMCGRLLCCLSYEYQTYLELNVDMPEVGSHIRCEDMHYVVISTDVLKQSMKIKDRERFIEISKSDLEKEGDAYCIKKDIIEKIKRSDDDPVEEDDYYGRF